LQHNAKNHCANTKIASQKPPHRHSAHSHRFLRSAQTLNNQQKAQFNQTSNLQTSLKQKHSHCDTLKKTTQQTQILTPEAPGQKNNRFRR
jgi:hypothetical protein